VQPGACDWLPHCQPSDLNHTIPPRNVVLDVSATARKCLRCHSSRGNINYSEYERHVLLQVGTIGAIEGSQLLLPVDVCGTTCPTWPCILPYLEPTSTSRPPTPPAGAMDAMFVAQTSQAQRLRSAQPASGLVPHPPSPKHPVRAQHVMIGRISVMLSLTYD
jgi:hypothetical protein